MPRRRRDGSALGPEDHCHDQWQPRSRPRQTPERAPRLRRRSRNLRAKIVDGGNAPFASARCFDHALGHVSGCGVDYPITFPVSASTLRLAGVAEPVRVVTSMSIAPRGRSTAGRLARAQPAMNRSISAESAQQRIESTELAACRAISASCRSTTTPVRSACSDPWPAQRLLSRRRSGRFRFVTFCVDDGPTCAGTYQPIGARQGHGKAPGDERKNCRSNARVSLK
jgi:hypothetical protein